MSTVIVPLKLLLLCVILNVIRYYVIGPLEMLIFLGPLFESMEKAQGYFNTEFTTMDWVTSYFYNFLMWLAVTIAYHKAHPILTGHAVVRSLKVYGLMWMMFASVSAIYMNHYSHPRDFYLFSILDALLVFILVSVANGFLYPLLLKKPATQSV